MKLDQFLLDQHIPFEQVHHEPTFTANRVAECLHVPGKEVAKSVLLRAPLGYMLAVLPSTHRIDLDRIERELGNVPVEMASEQEMDQLFPDCERGALPPFGSLYHLPTIVDETLTEDERIVFEAQSHQQAIRIAFRDFQRLEHPRIGHFARLC
jgi:Ala-tRNA(Pro) deacylase